MKMTIFAKFIARLFRNRSENFIFTIDAVDGIADTSEDDLYILNDASRPGDVRNLLVCNSEKVVLFDIPRDDCLRRMLLDEGLEYVIKIVEDQKSSGAFVICININKKGRGKSVHYDIRTPQA